MEMWKRLKLYEGIISIILLLNIIFYVINNEYLKYLIPKEVNDYMFWLSIGLWLGFNWCKYEVRRVLNIKNSKEFAKSSSTN